MNETFKNLLLANDSEKLEQYLQSGFHHTDRKLNARDRSSGQPAIIYAASVAALNSVRTLLKYNDVQLSFNSPDWSGSDTIGKNLDFNVFTAVAELLIDNGYHSRKNSRQDILSLLTTLLADPRMRHDMRNHVYGYIFYHLAAQPDCQHIVRELIKIGMDVNEYLAVGEPALCAAVMYRRQENVDALVAAKHIGRQTLDHGCIQAIRSHNLEAFRRIISHSMMSCATKLSEHYVGYRYTSSSLDTSSMSISSTSKTHSFTDLIAASRMSAELAKAFTQAWETRMQDQPRPRR